MTKPFVFENGKKANYKDAFNLVRKYARITYDK